MAASFGLCILRSGVKRVGNTERVQELRLEENASVDQPETEYEHNMANTTYTNTSPEVMAFFSSNNKYKSISKEDTPCAEKQIIQRHRYLLFIYNNILQNQY